MMNDVTGQDFIADRVTADLPDVAIDPPQFAVDESFAGGIVVVYGGHTFGVDPGKAESATAYVMWQVQDDVIAELGHPWPELVEPSGESVGVLTPLADSGVACWHLNARPWCAIGQLRGAAAAAGLLIR